MYLVTLGILNWQLYEQHFHEILQANHSGIFDPQNYCPSDLKLLSGLREVDLSGLSTLFDFQNYSTQFPFGEWVLFESAV